MEHTLGDILGAVLYNNCGNVPEMTYTPNAGIRIEYVGRNKISAIKAVRNVYGLTLKAAKDVIEWPGGWVTTDAVMKLLQKEYSSSNYHEHVPENWQVVKIRPEPINLMIARSL